MIVFEMIGMLIGGMVMAVMPPYGAPPEPTAAEQVVIEQNDAEYRCVSVRAAIARGQGDWVLASERERCEETGK